MGVFATRAIAAKEKEFFAMFRAQVVLPSYRTLIMPQYIGEAEIQRGIGLITLNLIRDDPNACLVVVINGQVRDFEEWLDSTKNQDLINNTLSWVTSGPGVLSLEKRLSGFKGLQPWAKLFEETDVSLGLAIMLLRNVEKDQEVTIRYGKPAGVTEQKHENMSHAELSSILQENPDLQPINLRLQDHFQLCTQNCICYPPTASPSPGDTKSSGNKLALEHMKRYEHTLPNKLADRPKKNCATEKKPMIQVRKESGTPACNKRQRIDTYKQKRVTSPEDWEECSTSGSNTKATSHEQQPLPKEPNTCLLRSHIVTPKKSKLTPPTPKKDHSTKPDKEKNLPILMQIATLLEQIIEQPASPELELMKRTIQQKIQQSKQTSATHISVAATSPIPPVN
eukprot:g15743.t1